MAPSVTAPNLATIPTIGAVKGLSTQEAAERLKKFGPNAVLEPKSHPIRAFLMKFWAPVPWMLEITFILEMALRKPVEAIIIALLLVGNAVLGFVEEGRAQAALEILRHRLEINARVMRDGKWLPVPARDLVPGDCIYLRMGDMVPADAHLIQGNIEVDQSALTGSLVITPRLILLLLFANDFVTMSLASDRVTPSPHPDRWNIRVLMWSSAVIAISWLLYCFAVFYMGRHFMKLPATQTLVFLALVFSGLATVYLVRESRAFWKSRPGTFLLCATAGDVVVVSAMAVFGILMAPVPIMMVLGLLAATIVMMFILDVVKKPLMRRLVST